MKIPNLGDIQAAINAQIAARGLDQYVEYVQYLPGDAPAPEDATHTLTLESKSGAKVQVAIKAKGFYSAIADIALSVL
jgi:hypothetical protein